MADLKAGTTVGGTPVWTQGTFPLFPTGNTLLYKTFKVYTENDKPQAADNDFVSKANGGVYEAPLVVKTSINIADGVGFRTGGVQVGNGDDSTLSTCNIDLVSWWGIGFKSSQGSAGRTLAIDTRTGNVSSTGSATFASWVASNVTPINANHLTRKDYVDGLINTTTNNANSRVLRSGDTMTGNLTVPAVYLNAEAANPNQAARLSQVVVRGTVLDYGEF